MRQRAKILGLTGGSGSGKSTAAQILREQGALVLDADKIAHEVMAAGGGAAKDIALAFGREYLLPDGTPDRKKLGALVFSDPRKRALLNQITHPRVTREIQRAIEQNREKYGLIVIDAALLLDCAPMKSLCDEIVVVCAPESVRINRIMERDALTERQARQRIGAQPPQEALVKEADRVWENSGDIAQLRSVICDH